MKLKSRGSSLLVLALASVASLAGCQQGSSTPSTLLAFKAVTTSGTSRETDATITIGTGTYKFEIDLISDKTLTFGAFYQGEVQQQGSGGGPGPSFAEIPSSSLTAEESSSLRDSSKDFSYTGSWVLEAGYGYALSIDDAKSSIIHTDYLKAQIRHDFYYNVTVGETSAYVHFQAQDADFKDTLAMDYKTYPERNATYVFSAGTSNLFLEKDKTVVTAAYTGVNRALTYSGDVWVMDGNDLSITGTNSTVKADASINSAHPGYRFIYNDVCYYCSTNASVANSSLVGSDFDGEALYTFSGNYSYSSGPTSGSGSGRLECTKIGKAVVSIDDSPKLAGTYTFAAEVFTLTFPGSDPITIAKAENGTYTYTYTFSVSSFFGSIDVTVPMIYNPGA